MGTDVWGIDDGYFDTTGQWRATPPATRQAIVSAMGAAGTDDVPPPSRPTCIVQQGSARPWPEDGELCLEDGALRPVAGRLPSDLPLGYHEFHGQGGGAPTRVIVCPKTCPLPTANWGWVAQLYAARSERSWGMGDLGDLARLARWARSLEAGLLLVNPLFAAAPGVPQEPSPYYPSSRRFLNPLYLRIEEIAGAERLGEELQVLAAAGRELNRQRRIDRDAVYRLKQSALKRLWQSFPGDARFDQFCQELGPSLAEFATFCALAERFGGDWRSWPAEYRDPRGKAVSQFGQSRRDQVAYHQWLQWLLDVQLAAAAGTVPLVVDVPLGFAPGGADAWVWQDLLAEGCAVGAPPDAFSPDGQDWAVPPLVPHKLRASGYAPLVETIRSALRYAGGLRIDHVLGLCRLYWIPQGFRADQGGYVRYQADEMLAILALESQRAGAFVCGEDLGTVEEETRSAMARHGVLSFRLLWFEPGLPEHYPPLAMAAVTTHDLPTISGLWTGQEEEARRLLGLPPNPALPALRRHLAQLLGASDEALTEDVICAAYELLARAPSLLLLATVEDAVGCPERPNMPDTMRWPNWSLALPGGLEKLETSDLPRRIAELLRRD
jgi:4-alpha-glucanotransferase